MRDKGTGSASRVRGRRGATALVLCGALALLAAAPAAAESPFDGNAMWIWQLPRTERGDLAAIVRKAKRNNVSALYIKSADGPTRDWKQFTPAVVRYFQSQGLKVCGWHYVYGRRPASEAKLSANAIRDGADCVIIDAEAEYEGRYAAADTYITNLRQRVGAGVPIALAGFPYVDYHPSFPYSVFLRPGGAQYNLPQMYWRAIGASVDEIFRHTYRWNQPYGRPLYPLGQLWEKPPLAQIRRFRRVAVAYGAAGTSWWDWQEAGSKGFRTTGVPLSAVTPRGVDSVTVKRGSRGDWVIWAQEHLNGAGGLVPVTGYFGKQTQAAVLAFQVARGLPATGELDPATWSALLAVAPVATRWSQPEAPSRRVSRAAAVRTRAAPASARLPAKRDELARADG